MRYILKIRINDPSVLPEDVVTRWSSIPGYVEGTPSRLHGGGLPGGPSTSIVLLDVEDEADVLTKMAADALYQGGLVTISHCLAPDKCDTYRLDMVAANSSGISLTL